jgi:hypothetical protein
MLVRVRARSREIQMFLHLVSQILRGLVWSDVTWRIAEQSLRAIALPQPRSPAGRPLRSLSAAPRTERVGPARWAYCCRARALPAAQRRPNTHRYLAGAGRRCLAACNSWPSGPSSRAGDEFGFPACGCRRLQNTRLLPVVLQTLFALFFSC